MPSLSGLPRAAFAFVFFLSALSGCSTITDTWTVQSADTYDLWAQRLPSLPVVFHTADGGDQTYDRSGHAIESPNVSQDKRRIELYVDTRTVRGATACSAADLASANTAGASKTHVVAALCDGPRVVVSYSEHARPRVVADRATYIAHASHVLMDGIWTSEAQTPPLPPQ